MRPLLAASPGGAQLRYLGSREKRLEFVVGSTLQRLILTRFLAANRYPLRGKTL
jgi:hypothetical protein